jgi:CheY-like chemotaxis protein
MSLEMVGEFEVKGESSGAAGIEQALQFQPDLILIDVMMPGIDGPETLKRFRSLPQFDGIPILFMSARVREEEMEGYLSLGANGVVPKPFDPMTLSEDVTELWRKFHARSH